MNKFCLYLKLGKIISEGVEIWSKGGGMKIEKKLTSLPFIWNSKAQKKKNFLSPRDSPENSGC